MTVAFDAVTSTQGSTSYTFTHTPVGTPTAVVVALTQNSSARNPTASYGGAAMSPLSFVNSPDGTTTQFLFGLPGPVSSAATVSLAWTGVTQTNSAAMTVTGSSITSPFGTPFTNSANSGNASLSMTAQNTGSLTVAVVGNNQAISSGAVAWSGASTGTQRWNLVDAGGFEAIAGQTVTTTGLLSFSWVNNASTSPSWGLIGVEILPPHPLVLPFLDLLGVG